MKLHHPKYFVILFIFSLLFLLQCKNEDVKTNDKNSELLLQEDKEDSTLSQPTEEESPKPEHLQSDDDIVEVTPESSAKKSTENFQELTANEGIQLDLRYASKNNFTKQKIYDCARCYLRPEAAKALLKAQEELQQKFGYSFKIFDCFRPRAYQQRLWDIVPDADYVTPPAKGSMHSRGLAVDLTLVDADGKELNMGTPFDFFGEEAHYNYNHSDAIKRNRWILKSTMEKYGFGGIRTEWWHFSYRKTSYPLDEWIWDCQ